MKKIRENSSARTGEVRLPLSTPHQDLTGLSKQGSSRLRIRATDPESKNKKPHQEAVNDLILSTVMVMSHDMRSLLISIATALKLFQKGIYGKPNLGASKKLDEMALKALTLIGMTEDFLEKAFWIHGDIGIKKEEIDLKKEVIDSVLEELTPEIQENNISVKHGKVFKQRNRIPLKANKICMRAIFRNLIKNAIKYGDEGCTIGFEMEEQDSYYLFHFYNTGTPIAEEYRDRLFTVSSGKTQKGKAGESGLGLFLIKEIIQKQGGDIWYEAGKNGSNFFLTLPLE